MDNITDNINNTNNKQKAMKPATTIALILLCAIVGILTTVPLLSVVFVVIAASLFAYVALSNNPTVAFAAPILSAGVLVFISRDVPLAIIYSMAYMLTGSLIALCISKKCSLYTAVLVGSIVYTVMTAAQFEYSIYVSYGSFADGTKAFLNELTVSATDSMNQMIEFYRENGMEISLTDDQIKGAVAASLTLMPVAFIVIAELVSTAVYFTVGMLSKVGKSFDRLYPRGFVFKMPLATSVFFLVCLVLLLIFATFENATVFYWASFVIVFALFLPMVIEGLVRLISKIRLFKKQHALGENKRPFPVFTVVFFIILVFMNPLTPLLFLAFYGALDPVRELISAKIKEHSEDS